MNPGWRKDILLAIHGIDGVGFFDTIKQLCMPNSLRNSNIQMRIISSKIFLELDGKLKDWKDNIIGHSNPQLNPCCFQKYVILFQTFF